MSTTLKIRSRGLPGVDLLVVGSVAALGLLTLTIIVAGEVAWAMAPLALSLIVLAVARAPLRSSLLVLGFLCLTMENPTEAFAEGKWSSPLAPLGALLLAHLNLSIPVKALIFSGLDLALVLLIAVWVIRRVTGSAIDLRGRIPAARPMQAAGLVCLVSIAMVWGFGMVRGGFSFSDSLWQIFRVVYLPSIFLLFCAGLRGPADARQLGIALVLAALVRSLLSIYIRMLFPSFDEMIFTTTHADSMLFSDAFLLLVVMLFEQPGRRTALLAAAALPVIGLGMIANNRRLAWLELVISLLAIFCVTPMTRLKRRVTRGVAISIPILILYVAIGWSSKAAVFAGARTVRSVFDSSSDGSTFWRDLENYNLYFTLKGNPLLGTGFGHPYEEVIHLPDISANYSLYRFAPHNSILGLVAYGGFVGFTGIWLLVPLGIFFAVRSYRFSTHPADRTAALTTVGILIAYAVHCYGDMGLGTWTSVFTLSAALALVAKQAVATGAWPLRRRGDEVQASGPAPAR
jgi:hypothetical protein